MCRLNIIQLQISHLNEKKTRRFGMAACIKKNLLAIYRPKFI